MGNTDIQEKVHQIFTDYLSRNGHRRTPERFAILDKIYSIDGHFSVEQLLHEMEAMKFRVSRATVYNTVTLLLDAKLIVRHSFNNSAQYEKSYNTQTHHHLICTECGRVSEFENKGIKGIIEESKFPRFTAMNYSLYVYGICSNCKRLKTIRMKKQNKSK